MGFKYIELFAGIGGFRSALDPLGGECVFASEIDPFATRAYKALYDGAPELHGDITKIDAHDIPDHDVLVGGFPCQAFSVAGQRKGFEEARGTLFFEIARIASAKQPRFMLLENVKGLLSHDGGATFETMCAVLNDIGYAIDFNVINSKYFGVPQNRERIFIVCKRDEALDAEWDIKGTGVVAKAKRRAQVLGIRTFNFDWPTNDAVTTRLRDVLESNVDEKYYLSEEKTAKLVAQLSEAHREKLIEPDTLITDDGPSHRYDVQDNITPPIRANGGGRTPGVWVIQEAQSGVRLRDESGTLRIGGIDHQHVIHGMDSDNCEMIGHVDGINGHDICRRVYSPTGVAPTIPTGSSGNTTPKIAVDFVGNVNPSGNGMNGSVYADSGLSPTLTTNKGEGPKVCVEYSRKTGIGRELDAAHTLSASDWRGLNRNQTQNAVLEVRAVLTPDRPEKRQNGRRFKENGEESFTLTAQDKHGIAIGKYPRYRIRKLTPLECWRLQGFTDEQHAKVASAGISDSQRYKMAGNAVSVPVISAVGERLVRLIEQAIPDGVTA